ncbi:MAG TPA: TrbI/VirB10 family protein [Thermoanaerobaculia bacterium]|nr:TrbI/VirB10 family protein [Thermoanaerobaculia bacterium]
MHASDQDPSTPKTAPEAVLKPDSHADNVRDKRFPDVVGPHYRRMLLATAALVVALGVALFFAPTRKVREEPRPAAPQRPEATFMDRPVAPGLPREGQWAPLRHGGGWGEEITVTAPDPGFGEPYPEVPAISGDEVTGLPPVSRTPVGPARDPREVAYERALKSASLRRADQQARLPLPSPGFAETQQALLSATSRLLELPALPGFPALGSSPQTPLPALPLQPPGRGEPEGMDPRFRGDDGGIGGATAGSLLAPLSRAGGKGGPGEGPGVRGSSPASPSPGRSEWAGRERGIEGVRISVLRAGTLIPARLETALDSDSPGPVLARVLRDVLDATGREVAIPAGALLLGSVENQLAYGENRMLVAFDRITTPLQTIDLPGFSGLETTGTKGLADQVDRHLASTLGKAVLLAALGAGFQLAQPDRGDRLGLTSGEVVAAQMALELNRVSQQLLLRQFDRRPTVKVRAGERFHVYVHQDLDLAGGAP